MNLYDYEYILNSNSKKIHKSSCSEVKRISDDNKESYSGDINQLIEEGYTICGKCKPE